MSQFDLARRIGVSQGTYSLIETGYVEPSDTDRDRIARALKVQPEDIFDIQPVGEVAR
jgi:DNA-binding XRE family transcriptional regulator